MSEQVILYQVMNFDRQEMFYGIAPGPLDKEIERLAKDAKGPAGRWQKGEVVSWKPLTDALTRDEARVLHRQFEQKTPPNKFSIIKTFREA